MGSGTQSARRAMLMVAVSVVGICLVALGVFFAWQGLDRADQLASVISVFVGLAGLGLAGYGTWLARHAPKQWPHGDQSGAIDQQNSGGINIASSGVVGGDVNVGMPDQ